MATTSPIHGGGAQPIHIDTTGRAFGGPTLLVYGFATAEDAVAAGFRAEAGPAMSVVIVDPSWLIGGDPKATPVYIAPDDMAVEGGYSTPITIANP